MVFILELQKPHTMMIVSMSRGVLISPQATTVRFRLEFEISPDAYM